MIIHCYKFCMLYVNYVLFISYMCMRCFFVSYMCMRYFPTVIFLNMLTRFVMQYKFVICVVYVFLTVNV